MRGGAVWRTGVRGVAVWCRTVWRTVVGSRAVWRTAMRGGEPRCRTGWRTDERSVGGWCGAKLTYSTSALIADRSPCDDS